MRVIVGGSGNWSLAVEASENLAWWEMDRQERPVGLEKFSEGWGWLTVDWVWLMCWLTCWLRENWGRVGVEEKRALREEDHCCGIAAGKLWREGRMKVACRVVGVWYGFLGHRVHQSLHRASWPLWLHLQIILNLLSHHVTRV